MPAAKKKRFSAKTEVKALAREQVGQVKSTRIVTPKKDRKPKYPPKLEDV
jgi:hypothetical protein